MLSGLIGGLNALWLLIAGATALNLVRVQRKVEAATEMEAVTALGFRLRA